MWAKRASIRDEIIKAGDCRIEFNGKGKFQVICPMIDEFVDRATIIGGRYRHKSGVWTFSGRLTKFVIQLCREVFPGRVTIKPYGGKEYRV